MKTFNIWAEGFACTGQSSGAQLSATVEAETFEEAVLSYKDTLPASEQRLIDKRGDNWCYWGCRLYDNGHDARKSFG